MKGAHKARGCRPGRADLLVLEAGADGTHGLAVELKVGGNGLLDSQVAWLARAQLKGWRNVGPWTRLRGDGRRECFDQSEAEWEVQARSVRSEQRDAKGRALQSPGEGDCERSWL